MSDPAPPPPEPPSPAGPPVRVAVAGQTRWGLWWADELAADPRFALIDPEDGIGPEPAATLRCETGRVTIAVPRGPDADVFPFRPGRFTAAFAAARTAVAHLGGSPRDFTLVEHTQTPLIAGSRAGSDAFPTARDRLEARLDELLALSDWAEPRLTHAERVVRGGEETARARVEDAATGGTALIEIVRGAAVRWEPGWSVRTPAGGYHAGTLTTREPGGELAARPWAGGASSPLDALHDWVAGGAAWPVTAAEADAVRGLLGAYDDAR